MELASYGRTMPEGDRSDVILWYAAQNFQLGSNERDIIEHAKLYVEGQLRLDNAPASVVESPGSVA